VAFCSIHFVCTPFSRYEGVCPIVVGELFNSADSLGRDVRWRSPSDGGHGDRLLVTRLGLPVSGSNVGRGRECRFDVGHDQPVRQPIVPLAFDPSRHMLEFTG
jgi:hypothetical protein